MPAILVVDDDKSIQGMLSDLLTAEGYEVSTCKDGRHVISTLEEEHFDLMVLDVLIPHVNGFALIDQLRSHPQLAELPVVMISGIYRSRNHRKQVIENFSILEYLDKPISTQRLLEVIHEAVGGGDAPEGRTAASAKAHGSDALSEPSSSEDADERLVDHSAQEEREEVEEASRKEFRHTPFSLEGSIRRRPVAAVLGKLWRERRSGILLLKSGKVKKIIYVAQGEPYFVKSNKVSECLGRLLMRERLISEEECAESVRRMKELGQKQGEVLIGMRCLTEKNVKFALELQLETKLFDTFSWTEGQYRFNSSASVPNSEVELEWHGPGIIVEGIRRAFDETRLRQFMRPILDVPLVFREYPVDLDPLMLTPKEKRAIESVSLPQTTTELLDSVPLDPPDTLRVLYTLIALEVLEPG